MTYDEVVKTDKECYMNTFGDRTPVCFEKGEGIYLYDKTGKKYIDFMGGIAVNALGHSHPILKNALHDQIDKLIHTSNLYYIENQTALAKKITENTCADKVFFANSGAEANEGAIKLARIYFYKKGMGEKNEIITLNKSFHGRTLATVAATGQEKYQKPYKPLTPTFIQVEANDIEGLKNAVTDKTCAIMLEVIQGESGVRPMTEEYLKFVRDLCDEKGIVLIFDEVQTGMGRTGKLMGFMNYPVEPDIFTMAKALGGGVPIGAVCAKDKVCAFEPGDHGTTFGGNPLATRAGLAVFEAFEKENLVENAKEVGEYFKEKLKNLSERIVEVRGMGLMIGVEIDKDAVDVKNKLFQKGVLCGVVGNTLRILPPLILTKEQVDDFINILKEVL